MAVLTIDGLEVWVGDLGAYARLVSGRHPRTILRWSRDGWPPWLLRLAALELDGQLGLIHPTWRGWRIDREGYLCPAPELLEGRGYTMRELLARLLWAECQLGHRGRRRARPRIGDGCA